MTAGDLCAQADVEALTGKAYTTGTMPTAAQITGWITDCSGIVGTRTGKKYVTTTVTAEKLNGNGTQYIKLNNRPLISVTSLSVDDSVLTASTDYWIVDYDAAVIEVLAAPQEKIEGDSQGHQNITITYTYGVTTIPAAVKQLCAVMVAMRALSAGALAASGGSVDSYSDGDISIKYSTGDSAAKALIAQYEELKTLVPQELAVSVGGLG